MATIKPFRKIQTSNAELMRVQDAVAEVISPLAKVPLLDARVIKAAQIGTSATGIDHGLGREPLGWFVIDKSQTADVWRSPTPSQAPNKLLMLLATSPVTVDLIVF